MTQYAGVSYLNCTFNLGQIPHDKVHAVHGAVCHEGHAHFRAYMPDQAKYRARTTLPIPKVFAWEKGCP